MAGDSSDHPQAEDTADVPLAAASSDSFGRESSSLELMPHDGQVFLDMTPGGLVVTHMQTLASKLAPSGHHWQLQCDDGFAALSAPTTDEVVLLEEWLTLQLYANAAGELVVMPLGGASCASARSLKVWMTSYTGFSGIWASETLFPDLTLPMFRLDFPRQGSSWWFDALSFFKLLSLNSYMGQASKWCFESAPSWLRLLARYGMQRQVMRSTQGLSSAPGLDDDRFLPKPAVSLRGMLCLLWRWASCSAQNGGLRADTARAKAMALALALVDGILSVELPTPFVITFVFDAAWGCRSPRPPISDGASSQCEVTPEGLLDIRNWRDDVTAGAFRKKDLQSKWFALFGETGEAEGFASIADLLQRKEFGDKDFLSFYAQLVCALAEKGEQILNACLTTASASWVVRAVAGDSKPNHPRHVDHELAVYVGAAKRATAGEQHISLAVDKAVVEGLSLQNAVLAMPSNLAFVLAPGVCGCQGAGARRSPPPPPARGNFVCRLKMLGVYGWVLVYTISACPRHIHQDWVRTVLVKCEKWHLGVYDFGLGVYDVGPFFAYTTFFLPSPSLGPRQAELGGKWVWSHSLGVPGTSLALPNTGGGGVRSQRVGRDSGGHRGQRPAAGGAPHCVLEAQGG